MAQQVPIVVAFKKGLILEGTFSASSLTEAFGLVPPGFTIREGYNIAPGQYIVIVRPERDQRVVDVAFWGLVPGWVKDPNAFSKPINARAETLEEKPSFRGAFRRKRCLIPASGFYEWKAEGRAKQPFYIHPANPDEPFAFAGLMEDWHGPNGEVMISACIITTEPNALMAPIHNRMPVILPLESWPLWLDPSAQTRELRPLLVPFPAERMAAHRVGLAVGDVRNDGPELVLSLSDNASSNRLIDS